MQRESATGEGGTRSEGDQQGAPWGAKSAQGGRAAQEDAWAVTQPQRSASGYTSTNLPSLTFFGVYDGHGGKDVAIACRDRLCGHFASALHGRSVTQPTSAQDTLDAPETSSIGGTLSQSLSGICQHRQPSIKSEFATQVSHALVAAFHRTDQELAGTEAGDYQGATAVVVVLGKTHIWVAHAGDSRAVLQRAGQPACVLTSDHKPDRADEAERIAALGGIVVFNQGANRISGMLAMSRALGDHFLRPFIIPDPEVRALERCADDQVLLVATDGLWDVFTAQEACTLAYRCIQRCMGRGMSRSGGCRVAASVMAKMAQERGSRDNITVIVVDVGLPAEVSPAPVASPAAAVVAPEASAACSAPEGYALDAPPCDAAWGAEAGAGYAAVDRVVVEDELAPADPWVFSQPTRAAGSAAGQEIFPVMLPDSPVSAALGPSAAAPAPGGLSRHPADMPGLQPSHASQPPAVKAALGPFIDRPSDLRHGDPCQRLQAGQGEAAASLAALLAAPPHPLHPDQCDEQHAQHSLAGQAAGMLPEAAFCFQSLSGAVCGSLAASLPSPPPSPNSLSLTQAYCGLQVPPLSVAGAAAGPATRTGSICVATMSSPASGSGSLGAKRSASASWEDAPGSSGSGASKLLRSCGLSAASAGLAAVCPGALTRGVSGSCMSDQSTGSSTALARERSEPAGNGMSGSVQRITQQQQLQRCRSGLPPGGGSGIGPTRVRPAPSCDLAGFFAEECLVGSGITTCSSSSCSEGDGLEGPAGPCQSPPMPEARPKGPGGSMLGGSLLRQAGMVTHVDVCQDAAMSAPPAGAPSPDRPDAAVAADAGVKYRYSHCLSAHLYTSSDAKSQMQPDLAAVLPPCVAASSVLPESLQHEAQQGVLPVPATLAQLPCASEMCTAAAEDAQACLAWRAAAAACGPPAGAQAHPRGAAARRRSASLRTLQGAAPPPSAAAAGLALPCLRQQDGSRCLSPLIPLSGSVTCSRSADQAVPANGPCIPDAPECIALGERMHGQCAASGAAVAAAGADEGGQHAASAVLRMLLDSGWSEQL